MGRVVLLFALCALFSSGLCSRVLSGLYDVEWDSMSDNELGSMPLGNGDLSLNVWVDPTTADLMIYIAKTDAFEENTQLLKIGRVRYTVIPALTLPIQSFSQRLSLADATVYVEMTDSGGLTFSAAVWVDALLPVVRADLNVSAASSAPQSSYTFYATTEVWRTALTAMPDEWTGPYYCDTRMLTPDVLDSLDDRALGDGSVYWYHRNDNNSYWLASLQHQGLAAYSDSLPNNIWNRTFGALVKPAPSSFSVLTKSLPAKVDRSGSLWRGSVGSVSSGSSDEIAFSGSFNVYCLTEQTDSADEWIADLMTTVQNVDAVPAAAARSSHEQWWSAFWSRSHIDISAADPVENQAAFNVSSLNALQRFMDAGCGRGAFPIKFNGAGYTANESVSNPSAITHLANTRYAIGADFRQWGGAFWFQNTRLPYYPASAAGDLDILQGLIQYYTSDAIVAVAQARTERWHEHSGVFYPETMNAMGTYTEGGFGFGCSPEPWTPYLVQSTYMRYHREGNLELLWLAFDYFAHTQDASFATKVLVPLADEVLTYYEQQFPNTDPNTNATVIFPSQGLETWQCPALNQCVTNPMPEVAGLRSVLTRALNLAPALTTPDQRARWAAQLAIVPALPEGPCSSDPSKQCLLPASSTNGQTSNTENVELYALHPYAVAGLARHADLLAAANASYYQRPFPCNDGWCQDVMFAAMLGLRGEVRAQLVDRAATGPAAGWRFPAFVGPFQDSTPNEDHLSNMRAGLSLALLQDISSDQMMPSERAEAHARLSRHHLPHLLGLDPSSPSPSSPSPNGMLLLFPAWPDQWNVDAQLHASLNTTLHAACKGGVVEALEVDPPSRLADVYLMGCSSVGPALANRLLLQLSAL